MKSLCYLLFHLCNKLMPLPQKLVAVKKLGKKNQKQQQQQQMGCLSLNYFKAHGMTYL